MWTAVQRENSVEYIHMRLGPSTWVWFHPYHPFHPFPLHPFHPFHPYGKPGVLYDPDEHPTNATVANIKMVRCMT